MARLSAFNFQKWIDEHKHLLKPPVGNQLIWRDSQFIIMILGGPNARRDFHIDPSDEVMYMIKGEMRLHYRTPEGKEEVTILSEGSTIFTPAGVPHSPRFPPDAFVFIIERNRRDGEIDRFQWYCPSCDDLLHEETFLVGDYAVDPVSKAYQNFFDSEEFRTCEKCGEVMPKPQRASRKHRYAMPAITRREARCAVWDQAPRGWSTCCSTIRRASSPR